MPHRPHPVPAPKSFAGTPEEKESLPPDPDFTLRIEGGGVELAGTQEQLGQPRAPAASPLPTIFSCASAHLQVWSQAP